MTSRKDRIRALLKGIETGDPESVEVVNEAQYIQHNPETQEGSEGLAALFARLAKTSPRVNIVRAFEDGDYVFAHTEYDFGSPKVGFEVFRFEGEQTVEHWDNIQPRQGPNASGREMVDGPIEAIDPERTEANRQRVLAFTESVLVGREFDRLAEFIRADSFAQHSPRTGDGLAAFSALLTHPSDAPHYEHCHRVLAEGSFVLAVSEGSLRGAHSAFYDLYRLDEGMLVEHWDTVESVPPRSEWKNDNGKF